MPNLTITSGALTGQIFSFSDNAIVGRGQLCDVRLNEPTVSRQHALLRRKGDDFEVLDQNSANGTLLRGKRINRGALLRDGDELRFGDVKAVFHKRDERALADSDRTNTSAPGRRGVDAAASSRALSRTGLPGLLARLKLFTDLGRLPAQAQDLRTQLGQALDAVLEAFPHANHAAVYRLATASDHLSLLVQRVRPKGSGAAAFAHVEMFLHEALRRELGLNVHDEVQRQSLTSHLEAVRLPAALLGLPLRIGRELLGMFYLDSNEHDDAWCAGDQELFHAVAGQLARLIAAHQARSPDQAIETHDLALARRIQQRFLPQSPPAWPGYRIADSYAAARVIGGDYYDFVQFADGRQGIVIADVSGKAVSGALYMARLGVQVRELAQRSPGPRELLDSLNDKLAYELEPGMFVTMLGLAVEPETGAIELANAGHPAPLLRHADGRVTDVGREGALPLGASADSNFQCDAATLDPGCTLLLYTDGLDEAHDHDQQLFGKPRIVDILARDGTHAQTLLDRLLEELARFSAGEAQSDDLTLIAISRES